MATKRFILSAQRSLPAFHLAFPCSNVEATKNFYVNVLGCEKGREAKDVWCDFNFFGHQLVCHVDPTMKTKAEHVASAHRNEVDSKHVPVPHFGAVLEWEAMEELIQRLKEHEVKFEIEPYVRFEGQVGEQRTMFFYDNNGNALEFKAFRDPTQLFAV